MLTLGLLNRNTGCQCCSVRCSSMLKLLCISNHIPNFSLDFQNFNFSTVRTVKRVELHHYAKCCRNRLNCGRDMVIIRFFKMAAAAILDFQNVNFLTFGTVKRVELRNHAKFCRNRSNHARDTAIFQIFKMADVAMLDF